MQGDSDSIKNIPVSEQVIRIPVEITSKPISEIEYEYTVELNCLKDKLKFLEESIDALIQENIQLKTQRDEVEAIKLQLILSERIRKDMKVCRALEIENQEIRNLILDLCNSSEIKGMIKFRTKAFEEKYQASPTIGYKINEIDLYGTYKKLVNYNDVMRSENIFLKIELARLQQVHQSRANVTSEYTLLKHEVNHLKDMISSTLNLSPPTSNGRKNLRSSTSLVIERSQRSLLPFSCSAMSSTSRKTSIENPFKSFKESIQEQPSNCARELPSIKSVMTRLEEILEEEKQISSHLTDKVVKCSVKREARYNSPEIYCKYFLRNSS